MLGDQAKKEMKLVNEFIDPIVDAAVKRNTEKGKSTVGEQVNKKDIRDDESFLDHLASQTSGRCSPLILPCRLETTGLWTFNR